jgi:3-dehydroquinate dehydratase/shikimate dehydrogenase
MDSPQKPRVCISVCESTVAALERAITAAAAVCNLIEVRLDCLAAEELEAGAGLITKLLEQSDCESILTLRPAEQGGRRELDDETRQAFWSSAIFSNSYFDAELDLAERFIAGTHAPTLPIDWSRTICSQHDFAGVPAHLDQLYDRLASTPARVLKIAVHADDAIDCLPVFQLLERARHQGREMIAIAMGPAGIATRILGPSRGAFLTYASPDDGTGTAPGQISARELTEVYRLEEIDHQTQIFGLLGQPVAHSVSPQMHNAAFAATGVNAVYIPFEVRDVHGFLKRMVHPRTRELDWNLAGLSVTAPHKSAVMDQLDWIAPEAREIGAVNTIVIEGDALRGHNTDAVAFIKPLAQKFGDLHDARCAVIGAGGAATAALWALAGVGANATLFVRDAAKARALAETFGVELSDLCDASIASFAGFDVVINATPLGTVGQFADETPATAEQLRGARLAYDLVYNPIETRFLREARAGGCETLGGLAMLVAQAAEQFRLWTDASTVAASTVSIEQLMRVAAERQLNLRSEISNLRSRT